MYNNSTNQNKMLNSLLCGKYKIQWTPWSALQSTETEEQNRMLWSASEAQKTFTDLQNKNRDHSRQSILHTP